MGFTNGLKKREQGEKEKKTVLTVKKHRVTELQGLEGTSRDHGMQPPDQTERFPMSKLSRAKRPPPLFLQNKQSSDFGSITS